MSKLKFFPLFPSKKQLGSERSLHIEKIVQNYLIPQNMVSKTIKEADLFLVASGDGGMISSIKAYHKYKKPFFGINCGRLGFLMNQVKDEKSLAHEKNDLSLIKLKLMRATFVSVKGEKRSYYAFNDIFCGGNISDFMIFDIQGSLSHFQNIKVKGSGIYISTPQGTTAYALNAAGSRAVIPLDSNTWYIGGIATGPYPCSIFKPQKVTITIESRETAYAYADGKTQGMKNVKKIFVTPTNTEITLAFLKNIDFEARRRALALAVSQGNFTFELDDLL